MYCYVLDGVDSGWLNARTVAQTVADLQSNADRLDKAMESRNLTPMEHSCIRPETFLRWWEHAKSLATENGWDGKLTDEPVVFWLPSGYALDCGFALRTYNNGSTYVISPVRMVFD